MKIVITGGAGFIGSALVRHLVHHDDHTVINVDKLTYAGNLDSLGEIALNEAALNEAGRAANYHFHQLDICDEKGMAALLRQHQPDAIVHLAAESHVDRSIDGPEAFIDTNVIGTYRLLSETLRYWQSLPATRKAEFRFHHVSTDEVYGSLGDTDLFTEQTSYSPNSPYSATKAASDHLVRAWHHTYGLPVVTSNCSNNYGPYQFPEKLIPLMIINAMGGKALPVYGAGNNIRDWLYVDDHVRALVCVLTQGQIGESYNIGGHNEKTNLDVIHTLCGILDELLPNTPHRPHKELIKFVKDRPGHDQRYAIDATKIQNDLGWQPEETFESGIRKTVQWYLDNEDWWTRVLDGTYRGERLGLSVA